MFDEVKKIPHRHSYSSLAAFGECRLLYLERYVKKSLPKTKSPQMDRGIEMHKTLQKAVETGKPPLSIWTPEGLIPSLHAAGAVAEGWSAIGWDGKPTQSWDSGAMLVGAMDVDMTDAAALTATVIDWKSGHTPASPLQADVYKVLKRAMYPGIQVTFHPIYVDLKKVETIIPDEFAEDRVFEAIDQAESERNFDPTPCKGCRWCPIKSCTYNQSR